jgi:FdhD protein
MTEDFHYSMAEKSSEIEISAISRDSESIFVGTGLQTREERKTDKVIREEEVVVRIDREIHKFYCIPTDLEEMILGNLKSRGINPSFSKIRKIADYEFNVDLLFVKGLIKNPQPCESKEKLTSKEVFNSVEMLNANGFLYKKTGCTHVIGICGDILPKGKNLEGVTMNQFEFAHSGKFVEDTSRHCAIDKTIGLAIRDGIDLSNSFLVTSCRQTASTIKKAIFCGIPIVISIAAPTDLAVKEANKYGITLIGFADSKRFNIYSHAWRIKI